MIIVLEGLDGSGKTYHAKRLANEYGFNYRHYPVDVDYSLPHTKLQQAMAADLIKYQPLEDENWVLDRYWQSSYVYGMDPKLLCQTMVRLPMPEINILLTISPQESYTRCQNSSKTSKWDRASIAEKQVLYDSYHRLHWDYIVNTETQSKDTVQEILRDLVKNHL